MSLEQNGEIMLSMKRLLLLMAAALPVLAADMTNLKIVVTNPEGKPVQHANVVVKFIAGREKIKFGAKIHKEWELQTSEEGVAKIPPIPQGKILLQVIAKNYQTYGQTVDVAEEEKTVEVKLNRPQPQYTAH